MDCIVHGVAKSQTRLSDFTFTFHFHALVHYIPMLFYNWESVTFDPLHLFVLFQPLLLGFPDGSAGKESTCSARDPGLIPGSRRSAGERRGYSLLYFWVSLVAQLIKNLSAMWGTWVQSLGWEDPLEDGNPLQYSCLEISPWTE